jgi:hypothetical protein
VDHTDVELTEVGGHTPGQLIVLPAMYRAYDLLAGLAARPRTSLVAGHDPLVRTRFAQHPAGPDVTDLTAPG